MKARIGKRTIDVFPDDGRYYDPSDQTYYDEEDLIFDDDIDWQSFRREAAKDILCAIILHDHPGETESWKFKENAVGIAIVFADELIKQLKKEK